MPILDNALAAIGNTPLIRLDRIAASHALRCNLRASHPHLSPPVLTHTLPSGQDRVSLRRWFRQGQNRSRHGRRCRECPPAHPRPIRHHRTHLWQHRFVSCFPPCPLFLSLTPLSGIGLAIACAIKVTSSQPHALMQNALTHYSKGL